MYLVNDHRAQRKSARAKREERRLRHLVSGIDSEIQLDEMLKGDQNLREHPILLAAVKKRIMNLEPRLKVQ